MSGPRLDVWLAAERGITRHAAQVLIGSGAVLVNGRPGKPGERVDGHDRVEVGEPRVLPLPTADVETPVNLVIVYEDDDLAVIDKPAGMVVHPAAGHPGGTVADGLRQRGSTWSLLGGAERPGIVHRLDRDTSGLLVAAKTEAAHRRLAAQFAGRTLGRHYWAMVWGGFREETGTIDAPIARDPRDRKRMAVADGGRAAITDFSVRERVGDTTILDIALRSGRTHQIRVHMAYIRHPVAGDRVYGRRDERSGRITRLALHARELHFEHPGTGRPVHFESPLPDDLVDLTIRAREGRL